MNEINMLDETKKILIDYSEQINKELVSILDYWMNNTVDNLKDGFFGEVDNNNCANINSSKGLVLNARILWTFSAAFIKTNNQNYLSIAQRAFDYINKYFRDEKFGGAYWLVDSNGNAENDRKQIYGLAFCIYGMSEYFIASKNKKALDFAVDFFKLIEEKSFDKENNGYFEAFTRDWKPLQDLRLSAKDDNEKKTMNTHLHIIEAYTNLYRAWTDNILKNRIIELLKIFDEYIIDKNSRHLILFFDENWNAKSTLVSYGHDIEAAWLLQECAEIINDEFWIKKMKMYSVKIAEVASEGLDKDGGLWYEFEPKQNHFIKQKHWWPQAEAMIGFFNAWQITDDKKYLNLSLNSWEFIKKYMIDHKNGEWFWGINEDQSIMQNEYKTGFWKCPYHNARACIEINKRIQSLL